MRCLCQCWRWCHGSNIHPRLRVSILTFTFNLSRPWIYILLNLMPWLCYQLTTIQSTAQLNRNQEKTTTTNMALIKPPKLTTARVTQSATPRKNRLPEANSINMYTVHYWAGSAFPHAATTTTAIRTNNILGVPRRSSLLYTFLS